MNPLWWYGIGYAVGVFITAFISGMMGNELSSEETVWAMMFWPLALVGVLLVAIHRLGGKLRG